MPDGRLTIERAATHIGNALNDLHWATLAVDLPAARLRERVNLAVAELDEAKRQLAVADEELANA